MTKFFDNFDSARRILQVYNLVVAAIATHALLTNPEATLSEVGTDALLHLWTAHSLENHTSPLPGFISMLANTARMGSIFTASSTRCTAVPDGLAIADFFNHMVNTAAGVISFSDSEEISESDSQMAPH